MERIIKIFLIYRAFFTFLLCISLSIILIFSNQTAQVTTLRVMAVNFSGSITEKLNWFTLVFNALDENRALKAENQRLSFENALYREVKEENERLKDSLEFKKASPFEFRAGHIIHWSVPLLSTVTIDLGLKDGARKNNPVISNGRLVGKIIEAGESTSICQLLTDANFRVSSQIRNSDSIGFLEYFEGNSAIINIQNSAEVAVGDSVVTSSFGDIYPPGIPIGSVSDFTREPGLFKTVTVKLFVKYESLKEVSVIVNSNLQKDSWN